MSVDKVYILSEPVVDKVDQHTKVKAQKNAARRFSAARG